MLYLLEHTMGHNFLLRPAGPHTPKRLPLNTCNGVMCCCRFFDAKKIKLYCAGSTSRSLGRGARSQGRRTRSQANLLRPWDLIFSTQCCLCLNSLFLDGLIWWDCFLGRLMIMMMAMCLESFWRHLASMPGKQQ